MEDRLVKDLMISLDEYATVSADATLRQALQVLEQSQSSQLDERHRYRAVLVLDERGAVVGKLSHWAVLRKLEPKLFRQEDFSALSRTHLSPDFIDALQERFARYAGGLAQMCREAARLRASDAMVPAGEAIDEETPLVEAIHHLVVEHSQSVLVSRDDEIVGILRLSDVFEEVASLIRSCDADG